MELIDKNVLVAEIERLQHLNECYKRNWQWKFKWFSRTVIGRLEVLEGIKNFIEKKHPDATFSNKLKTARKIFYNRFYNRKVSFNAKDIKKYLDYQLSESKIQKEILDIYYKICKQENK